MFYELLICIGFILLIASFIWYKSIPPNLPPGPLGLPFFGATFQTYNPQLLHDNLLKWRHQYGPIFKFYVMNKLIVALGSYETIHEAFVKQGDAFSGRLPFFAIQNGDRGLTDSEGEAWKVRRNFTLSTLRGFGFGKSSLEPKIRDLIDRLVEYIEHRQNQPIDLQGELIGVSLNIMFILTLGRPLEPEEETYKRFFDEFQKFRDIKMSVVSPFVFSKFISRLLHYTPIGKHLKETWERMENLLRKEIRAVAAQYRTDDEPTNYVEAFVQMQRKQPDNVYFSEECLMYSFGNLLGGGSETTAATVQWALLYLSKYPEVQEKIYEELRAQGDDLGRVSYANRLKVPYTEATILEIQRCINLTPHSVLHRCTVANKLCGYDIPEDALLLPIMSSSLHDNRTFNNSDQFCPERFLDQNVSQEMLARNIAFGIGKRSCMGESLAKMELFLLITTLVARFQFSFASDETVSLDSGEHGFLSIYPPRNKLCAKARL